MGPQPQPQPQLVQPFRLKVDLGGIATKEYSIFVRAPELEPHFRIQFSVIPMEFARGVGVLPLRRRVNLWILRYRIGY